MATPRKPGHLTISVHTTNIQSVMHGGVSTPLPDNINKTSSQLLFQNMVQLPLYKLTAKIASQFKPDSGFPRKFIIEAIRPAHGDLVVSVEGNSDGVKWLCEPDKSKAFSTALEMIFIDEAYLADLNVASVNLRIVIDPEEAEKVIQEYANGSGFTEAPTEDDMKLFVEIETYHVQKMASHLHWARDTESWLEASLGSFLMSCKQLLPNGEPLTDAVKLERQASMSSRASIDKMGMASFANAFRKIATITKEMNNNIIDRIVHTHYFGNKSTALGEKRDKIVDHVKMIYNKYSSILEKEIRAPDHSVYDPWRSKVLAKEVDLYLPLVSIIPFFKEHLLDLDVHMDEFKAEVTSVFPNESRKLSEIVAVKPETKAKAATKPSIRK